MTQPPIPGLSIRKSSGWCASEGIAHSWGPGIVLERPLVNGIPQPPISTRACQNCGHLQTQTPDPWIDVDPSAITTHLLVLSAREAAREAHDKFLKDQEAKRQAHTVPLHDPGTPSPPI